MIAHEVTLGRLAWTGTLAEDARVRAQPSAAAVEVYRGRVQGFGAGAGQPVTLVVIFKAYPADRRGLAMSLYAMGIMIAPILGPVVGGITIDWISWRHVFFIPLPVAGIAMLMALLFMPTKDPAVKRPPFDWSGYILVGLAIVCLMTAVAYG